MVCFRLPRPPNHVLGVIKSVSSGPADGTAAALTERVAFFSKLSKLVAGRIYKKLCYISRRYNINRMLICGMFWISLAAK